MTQQRVLTVLGVVALVGIVVAVVLLATGSEDSKVSVSAASTTSSSAVSVPVPSSSTTLAASTTSSSQGVTGTCAQPEDASQAFVDGWKAGDQAAAGRCGSTEAVATMFQTDGSGAQYTFQGCDYTDPGVPVCSYTYPGGGALTIEGTEAAGWKVTKVEFIAD